jgi:hypothetical protein
LKSAQIITELHIILNSGLPEAWNRQHFYLENLHFTVGFWSLIACVATVRKAADNI